MERKKMINCLVIWILGITLCEAQVHAKDSVFLRHMFTDLSMHGPFIVTNIQFEEDSKSFALLTKNGVLLPMVRETYNFKDDREYTRLMLYLSSRDQPLILPIKFKEKLAQFLLPNGDAKCEVEYSIRPSEKPDKFIKASIEVKYPITDAERNCIIFEMYKKNELVNTFTESGKLYISH